MVLPSLGPSHAARAGLPSTGWADWADLVTPAAVLGTAALAANAIGNVAPGPTAHLWDEVVGHYLWYLGWFVVVAALARAVHEHPMPTSARARAGCLLLAVGVGVTAGTNALQGGTIPLTAAATLAGIGHGLRRRGRLPELLAWAGGCTLLVIAAWGLWTGGFAQPSALRPFSPR